jgi:hypothetical protein
MEEILIHIKILYIRHGEGESLVIYFNQIEILAKGGILMI